MVRAAVAEPVGTAADATEIAGPLLPTLSDRDQAALQRLGLRLDAIQDIYPATPLQQGLIYHGLLQQGEGVYVNQLRFTLAGALARPALRAAWEGAVARHDVLRTGFEWRHGGETLQIVCRQARLPYAEHDW